ncbi:FAD-dependent oxidoreductase [bacterium]|nr:FAD-dependent oxidoreductase [bacterium]
MGTTRKHPAPGAETVREPARNVPVAGAYDVVVAGGGMAGVAAAVAAARNGASVCLLERMCALGGLATLGNVTVWLPICDGRGRQVIAGLPEELLKLSVADLPRDNPAADFRGVPACWLPGGDTDERLRTRYSASFNPASYLLSLERLVLDAGVRLLYDTRVCAVHTARNRITHLIIENKSGRTALASACVIDATGDADVCFLAGEETESLDTNVLCGWYYHFDGNNLHLHQLSNRYSPEAAKEDATGPFFRGDDAAHVTGHITATRDMIRAQLDELRRRLPERDIQPVMAPSIACFRMTRRLCGTFSLGARHAHEWFDDAIGLTGDWRQAGPVYAIPWRTIAAVKTRNLAAAGRCISDDTTAWDVMRAIPGCTVTGTAAGTAAALAARDARGDLASLRVADLQDALRAQGALISPGLVTPCQTPAGR